MKRSYFYIGGLLLITFTTFLGYYSEFKYMNYRNSSNTDNAFYIDKQEYQKEVDEWRGDKANRLHPLSNLFKDNIFVLEFEGQDSITVIRILANSKWDDATVLFHKWTTDMQYFDRPISLEKYQRRISGWRGMIGVGLGWTLEKSKSEFLDYIDSVDHINGQYGQVWDYNERRKSFQDILFNNLPNFLIVSFLIVFVSFLARILSARFKLNRQKFELIIYTLLPWIFLILFEVFFRQPPFDISIKEIVNPALWSMAILVFLLTKDRINKIETFGEHESLEFLYIVVIGVVATFITIAVHNTCFDYSYEYFGSSVVRIGLIVATANFLNNFRIHYFKLRKDGKSLLKAQVKEQASTSELAALQSRVNPHFLYNSLNSIAALAESDPEKTKQMTLALSEFYKYSANREDEFWSTIGEEIEMVKKYLEIEKIRFGDKLQYIVRSHDAENYKIPRFTIQPLVENAIKYGYDEKSDSINIVVGAIADQDGKSVSISVEDGGIDFPSDMDMGYGIRSVQKKLKLMDSNHSGITFSNKRRFFADKKSRKVVENGDIHLDDKDRWRVDRPLKVAVFNIKAEL